MANKTAVIQCTMCPIYNGSITTCRVPLYSVIVRRFLVQQMQNGTLEGQWILTLVEETHCDALLIYQVLEKIVAHMFMRQVLLELLVDGIVFQGARSKNRKINLRKFFLKEIGNLRIRSKLLVIVVAWKSQNPKALFGKLLIQNCKIMKLELGFASQTSSIHHQRDHSCKLTQRNFLSVNIGHIQTVDRIRRQFSMGNRRIDTLTRLL